jgi:hypothetical protein
LTTAVAGALLALTAGLALIAFVKFYGIVFLGITRSDRAIPLLPMPWQGKLALALLALCLIIESLSIPWLMQFVATALAGQVGKNIASTLVIWPHLALQPAFGSFSSVSPTEIAMTLIIFSLFPFLLRRLLRASGYRRSPTPVWSSASGWQERMITYTPLAFSNMMRVVFQSLYQLRRHVHYQHSPLRPGPISYRSQVRAPFEEWLYQPAIRIVLRIAALVRRTQSGSLGLYLFYLLLVLLAILTVMPLVLGGI